MFFMIVIPVSEPTGGRAVEARGVLTPFIVAFALVGPLGCGGSGPASPGPAAPPAEAAARAFGVAQGLEREHKTKQAFAAYHQVARQFPETAEGKKAAARIRQAQKAAGKARGARPR
jgi:hypothetical protein